MNTAQLEAKAQYIQDVQRFIKVDEDKHGRIICPVPSSSNPEGLEDGAWHTVTVDDQTTIPHAYHCTCESFQYNPTRSCRHQEAVAVFYARIYKHNTPENTQEYIAKQAEKAGKSKSNWDTTAALNGTRAFNMYR
jgi:hypothetical protein